MNRLVLGAILTFYGAGLGGATAAAAMNDTILLTQEGAANHADIAVAGDGNRLVIDQTHSGLMGDAANSLRLDIQGDGNGGPVGAGFRGMALNGGLVPGRLEQSGSGNVMDISVLGDGNLFAAIQAGSGNSLYGSITGHNNQAAVTQIRSGNYASFTQNGIGNSISIRQYGW